MDIKNQLQPQSEMTNYSTGLLKGRVRRRFGSGLEQIGRDGREYENCPVVPPAG